jgi:hypothetical protein
MTTLGFGQSTGQIVQTAYVVFSAPVPSGGAVYYMSDDAAGAGGGTPGFVELIPATPGMDEMFTRYWRASVDWNGEDPIRPFG